jgi:hypothetical protein
MSAGPMPGETWLDSPERFEAELEALRHTSLYGFPDDEDSATADRLMDDIIDGVTPDVRDIEFVCRWAHEAAIHIAELRFHAVPPEPPAGLATTDWETQSVITTADKARMFARPAWAWPALWVVFKVRGD